MIEIHIFEENHRFSEQTSAGSVPYLPNVGGSPSMPVSGKHWRARLT